MAKNNDTVVLENDDNHHHVKINDANKDGNNYNRESHVRVTNTEELDKEFNQLNMESFLIRVGNIEKY